MIRTFRRWLSQDVDYDWMVGYFASATNLAVTRVLIGGACLLFTALYVVMAFAHPAAPTGVAVWLILGNAVGTALVGVTWLVRRWPGRRMSLAFVFYSDVGVALVLLLVADPLLALPCSILFAVATTYTTTFHPPKVFAVHQLFVIGVVAVLVARSLVVSPQRSSEALIFGFAIMLVLFLAPVSNYRLQVQQRTDLNSAFVDPLSGIFNRRGLALAADELADRARTSLVLVSAVVVDLDNFKAINDTYGHHHGDLVIRRTARTLGDAFPAPSVTARTGGEEFAVVTPMSVGDVIDCARRMMDSLAESEVSATVSVGVASGYVTRGTDVEMLIAHADHAMFGAKSRGGNRIEVDSRGPIGGRAGPT